MKHDFTITAPSTEENPAPLLMLGRLLGRREAFNLIGSKCSAADIDCVRQIRDQRLYKLISVNFAEFCLKILGCSKTQINLQIRYLEKFGPNFFAISQFTRVPPKIFALIEPHLTSEGLTLDGETLALSAENAEKLTAAVAELRERAKAEIAAAAPPPPPEKGHFELLQERMQALISQIAACSRKLDHEEELKASKLLTRIYQSSTNAGIPFEKWF